MNFKTWQRVFRSVTSQEYRAAVQYQTQMSHDPGGVIKVPTSLPTVGSDVISVIGAGVTVWLRLEPGLRLESPQSLHVVDRGPQGPARLHVINGPGQL